MKLLLVVVVLVLVSAAPVWPMGDGGRSVFASERQTSVPEIDAALYPGMAALILAALAMLERRGG